MITYLLVLCRQTNYYKIRKSNFV